MRRKSAERIFDPTNYEIMKAKDAKGLAKRGNTHLFLLMWFN